MCNILFQGWCW